MATKDSTRKPSRYSDAERARLDAASPLGRREKAFTPKPSPAKQTGASLVLRPRP